MIVLLEYVNVKNVLLEYIDRLLQALKVYVWGLYAWPPPPPSLLPMT